MRHRVIFIIFILIPIIQFSQTNWYKYPGNPILSHGDQGEWDQAKAYQPQVIFDNGKYYMWFVGERYTRQGQLGLAFSNDGLNWIKHENNPVLRPNDPDAWEEWILDFCVIKLNTTYYLYYAGQRSDLPLSYRIGLAVSNDGINWERHPEPILKEGVVGTWDDWTLGEMGVIHKDNHFHMWYTGGSYETPSPLCIGYAWSSDGIEWTKHPGNPVLKSDSSGWDKQYVIDPIVYYLGSSYNMLYTGSDYNNFRIGYASSNLNSRYSTAFG